MHLAFCVIQAKNELKSAKNACSCAVKVLGKCPAFCEELPTTPATVATSAVQNIDARDYDRHTSTRPHATDPLPAHRGSLLQNSLKAIDLNYR